MGTAYHTGLTRSKIYLEYGPWSWTVGLARLCELIKCFFFNAQLGCVKTVQTVEGGWRTLSGWSLLRESEMEPWNKRARLRKDGNGWEAVVCRRGTNQFKDGRLSLSGRGWYSWHCDWDGGKQVRQNGPLGWRLGNSCVKDLRGGGLRRLWGTSSVTGLRNAEACVVRIISAWISFGFSFRRLRQGLLRRFFCLLLLQGFWFFPVR